MKCVRGVGCSVRLLFRKGAKISQSEIRALLTCIVTGSNNGDGEISFDSDAYTVTAYANGAYANGLYTVTAAGNGIVYTDEFLVSMDDRTRKVSWASGTAEGFVEASAGYYIYISVNQGRDFVDVFLISSTTHMWSGRTLG